MTSFSEPVKVRCAVCGIETEYLDIASTNTFGGSPDLDTRPPEMARSTMFFWVSRCPKCGYCSTSVSEATPHAALVRSREYSCQLNDPTYPELANSFLCKALIDERSADYSAAAWSLIHAAWDCDDEEMVEPAKTCRIKAVHMIRKALASGQRVADQDGATTAIQVDLLRRAGRLDDARRLIIMQRSGIDDDFILKILDFQERLVSRGDEACHTISEVIGESE